MFRFCYDVSLREWFRAGKKIGWIKRSLSFCFFGEERYITNTCIFLTKLALFFPENYIHLYNSFPNYIYIRNNLLHSPRKVMIHHPEHGLAQITCTSLYYRPVKPGNFFKEKLWTSNAEDVQQLDFHIDISSQAYLLL